MLPSFVFSFVATGVSTLYTTLSQFFISHISVSLVLCEHTHTHMYYTHVPRCCSRAKRRAGPRCPYQEGETASGNCLSPVGPPSPLPYSKRLRLLHLQLQAAAAAVVQQRQCEWRVPRREAASAQLCFHRQEQKQAEAALVAAVLQHSNAFSFPPLRTLLTCPQRQQQHQHQQRQWRSCLRSPAVEQ